MGMVKGKRYLMDGEHAHEAIRLNEIRNSQLVIAECINVLVG